MGNPSEFSALFAAAREGNVAALGRLWTRHERYVTAVARRGLSRGHRPTSEAPDVVQNVFLDVQRSLPRLRDQGEAAWRHLLATTAERRARDLVRTHARRCQLMGPRSIPFSAAGRRASESDPAWRADERERLAAAKDALARLGSAAHVVVMLRVGGALGFEEIAQLLGLPTSESVRKRYARTVRRLLEELRRRHVAGHS